MQPHLSYSAVDYQLFSCSSFFSPLCFQPDSEDKIKGIPPPPWSRELGKVRVGSIGLSLVSDFIWLGSLWTPEPRDFLLTVPRLGLRHTPFFPGPCGAGSARYICIDPLPWSFTDLFSSPLSVLSESGRVLASFYTWEREGHERWLTQGHKQSQVISFETRETSPGFTCAMQREEPPRMASPDK